MDRRIVLGAALCGSFVVPLAADAQNGTENYYYPPTIKSFGKSALAVAGAGQVVVKVLVKADGSFTVSGVVRSTNHADDATALDIAKHSTYHPAARGAEKKPVTAFYDFTIKFTGSGASAGDEASSGESGSLASYESSIRSGRYPEAVSGLQTYLQAHPGDSGALVDLGVAQSLGGDDTAAAATFDKTTVPDKYKTLAARAYAQAAGAAEKAKQNDVAVGDAKKAAALEASAYTSNALGSAELAAGDDQSAIADFQKARDLGTSEKLKAGERAAIDLNLVAALYAGGKDDDTKPVLAEAKTLDPDNPGIATVVANHDITLAQQADAANRPEVGEGFWEQAALAVPAQAGSFYGHAALDEVSKKSGSDLAKAKDDADKGLAVDPSNAVCNYVAGYVLAKQGKKSDALTYLNKADASAKSSGDTNLTNAVESLLKQVNGS